MKIVYEESAAFWIGKGWLVIGEDGEPPLAYFAEKWEAEQFITDAATE